MPRRADTVLTDAVLRRMQQGERMRDAQVPGLMVRRGATEWSWTLRYVDPVTGNEPSARLGTYPAIPIDDARALARQERDRIARGEQPAAKVHALQREAIAARNKVGAVPTVLEVWADYVERKLATSRADGGRALDMLVRRDIGTLAHVRADAATPVAAQAVLDAIVARGARSMAAQFREALCAAWRFAHQQKRLDRNIDCPFDGLMKDGSRDRLASAPKAERFRPADWRAWLAWLPRSGISPTMQDVFMLQAYTGARVGEVISARPDQIEEIDGGAWLRMYFKRAARSIYLNAAARRIVEKRRQMNPGAAYLFPSDRSASGHVNPLNAVTCLLAVRADCPIKLRDPRTNKMVDWTSHTIRRSVKAGLTSELKAPHELSEIVLGHSLGTGVVAAYSHESDYEREIAATMERWGKLVASWAPRRGAK